MSRREVKCLNTIGNSIGKQHEKVTGLVQLTSPAMAQNHIYGTFSVMPITQVPREPPGQPSESWALIKPRAPQEICKQHFSALS